MESEANAVGVVGVVIVRVAVAVHIAGERSHHQFAGQDNSIMTGPIYRLGQILESFLIRFLYAGN